MLTTNARSTHVDDFDRIMVAEIELALASGSVQRRGESEIHKEYPATSGDTKLSVAEDLEATADDDVSESTSCSTPLCNNLEASKGVVIEMAQVYEHGHRYDQGAADVPASLRSFSSTSTLSVDKAVPTLYCSTIEARGQFSWPEGSAGKNAPLLQRAQRILKGVLRNFSSAADTSVMAKAI